MPQASKTASRSWRIRHRFQVNSKHHKAGEQCSHLPCCRCLFENRLPFLIPIAHCEGTLRWHFYPEPGECQRGAGGFELPKASSSYAKQLTIGQAQLWLGVADRRLCPVSKGFPGNIFHCHHNHGALAGQNGFRHSHRDAITGLAEGFGKHAQRQSLLDQSHPRQIAKRAAEGVGSPRDQSQRQEKKQDDSDRPGA